jgi:hypothetical protein
MLCAVAIGWPFEDESRANGDRTTKNTREEGFLIVIR